jgi:hypothetical protein
MVVLPSTGASHYHTCCIDDDTSPKYFGYHLVYNRLVSKVHHHWGLIHIWSHCVVKMVTSGYVLPSYIFLSFFFSCWFIPRENYFEIIQNFSFANILYGSENWTLTALQRRRTGAAEMKLLRPLAGHTVLMTIKQTTPYAANYRLNAYWTRQMNTEGTGFYTRKECHKTESL